MAEKLFMVFNQTELPHRELQGSNKKHGKGEVKTPPVEAMFVEVEAENETEGRQIIFDKFGGDVTQLPVIVKAANWKTT